MHDYRPIYGTDKQDLETPCLVIDLDAMENNFDVISKEYSNTVCKMRQHAKNIKCPEILQKQIAQGGTNGGICTAKVSEAELMVEGGITDILITSQIVGKDKLDRLTALAKRGNIKVCVDNRDNLIELSTSAVRNESVVGILIEVDTSMNRAGIRNSEEAVALAKIAQTLPGVKFLGVMSHQTIDGEPDRETRFLEGKKYIDMCLAIKTAIENEGIPVTVVSSGETFTYDVATRIQGVTEVEGGTYALMSDPTSYMNEFTIAGKVLVTVIDVKGKYITIDAGYRELGGPLGITPVVEGFKEILEFECMSDTYSVLRSHSEVSLDIGSLLYLHSSQSDILVNRWDSFVGLRKDRVELVLDITARGCHN
jgi:3-hydroxy-D-aspartate aldolase